jgi:hypothetical protein
MRYEAVYSNRAGRCPHPPVVGIVDNRTGRFHPRPEYSDLELGATCRWLNGRDDRGIVHNLSAHREGPTSHNVGR